MEKKEKLRTGFVIAMKVKSEKCDFNECPNHAERRAAQGKIICFNGSQFPAFSRSGGVFKINKFVYTAYLFNVEWAQTGYYPCY